MTTGSSNLTLENFDPRYLEDLHTLRSNRDTQALLLSPICDESIDQTASWIGRRLAEKTTIVWLILDARTRRFLGFLQFIEIHGIHKRCELGIALTHSARGRGIGEAAIRQGIERMKAQYGITKFSVYVRSDHEAAIRLYEKLNFRLVGTCERHCQIETEWLDVWLMELVN